MASHPARSRAGSGSASAKPLGFAVGDAVGVAVGDGVGLAVGEAVGLAVGEAVGLAVGEAVGLAVGEAVGLGDGVGVDSASVQFSEFVFEVETIVPSDSLAITPRIPPVETVKPVVTGTSNVSVPLPERFPTSRTTKLDSTSAM